MRGHVKRAIEAMRSVDRRLSRRGDRRRVLFNARTPMNYAMFAPVHRALVSDPRVEVYFTASEAPDRATAILREAGADARIVSPRRASLMRFDAYIAADLLWLALPRGPSRPTVLYGPTWSAASSINLLGMEFIERLVAGPWNTVVKLHDRLRDERPFYSGGLDWGGRLAPALQGAHARLASGANICPCLAAADVMITDHSSAGFEYLLLDRPLVRVHVPE